MFPKALVLQLDYHKTLPCPKVSAQDSHYSRKLRTNLLGIYCANEETIHCFLYDVSVSGAGPNEVISLLNNLLIRFNIDTKEKPRMVSFYKKKQMTDLNSDLLVPVRHQQRPVNNQVKKHCLKLARKYLSERAQAFYASLACEEDSADDEG